jgi:hypothetical protein
VAIDSPLLIMMTKKIKNIIVNGVLPIIVFGIVFIFIFMQDKKNETKEQEIIKSGIFLNAIVNKTDATKGGHRTLEYSYRYNKKYYSDRSYVSKEFYKKIDVGDTIIIKTIYKYIPFSIVCENINYSSKYEKQPILGWKNLQ